MPDWRFPPARICGFTAQEYSTLNLRINPTVKQRAEDVLTRLGIEKAVANASDARREWIEAALEEGIKINEPDSLEDYSGQFKLRLPRSLHRLLAEHSKREGISMTPVLCVSSFKK